MEDEKLQYVYILLEYVITAVVFKAKECVDQAERAPQRPSSR